MPHSYAYIGYTQDPLDDLDFSDPESIPAPYRELYKRLMKEGEMAVKGLDSKTRDELSNLVPLGLAEYDRESNAYRPRDVDELILRRLALAAVEVYGVKE